MPHRMAIELTSKGPEGTWTWRAAGARQPRGTLAAELVPPGSQAGEVLRAEVESGIDGIEVVGILLPKPAGPAERGDRIEMLGSGRHTGEGAPSAPRPSAPGRRGPVPSRRRLDALDEGSRKRGRAGAEQRGRARAERRGRAGAEQRGRERAERRVGPLQRRASRPAVSLVHRDAALATLGPEDMAIAEELLRGGLPAVRRAIERQNASALTEGLPPVAVDALLSRAERLVPAMSLAAWKDRAASAQAAGKDLRLRELRAVVTASRTVSLDDEGKAMARALQEHLDQRLASLRQEWTGRIGAALDGGKIAEALRAAARPPEPGARCPAEMALRLSEAAGGAMTGDLEPGAWMELLEAVAESPVRTTVRPAGIPEDRTLRAAALRNAGLVPHLARQLGLPAPPPPAKRRPTARRATRVRAPVAPDGAVRATGS